MASPQLENGFTKVVDELLEVLYRTPFSGTQFKIVLYAIRWSYGYHRKDFWIKSLRRLAVELDQDYRGVTKAFNLLLAMNVLVHVKDDVYRLNKDYEGWGHLSPGTKVPGEKSSQKHEKAGTAVPTPSHSPNKEKREGERETPLPPSDSRPTPEKLMRLWNKLAPAALPRVTSLSKWREEKCRARLKEHPEPEWWLALMEKLGESRFLQGKGETRRDGMKTWKATFDWLIKNDHNAVKVTEGNFDDEQAA